MTNFNPLPNKGFCIDELTYLISNNVYTPVIRGVEVDTIHFLALSILALIGVDKIYYSSGLPSPRWTIEEKIGEVVLRENIPKDTSVCTIQNNVIECSGPILFYPWDMLH